MDRQRIPALILLWIALLLALPSLAFRASAEETAPDATGTATSAYSLDECIERAVLRSTQLDILRTRDVVNAIAVSEAHRRFFPTASFSWSQRDYDLGQVREQPGSIIALEFFRQIQAWVNQPIYTGGRLSASLDAARARGEADAVSITLGIQELVLLVKQAYHNLLRAETTLNVNGRTLEKATESLALAEKKLELKQGLLLELLGEKSFYAESQVNELTAQQGVKAAKRALLLLMEDSPGHEGIAIQTLPPTGVVALGQPEVLNLALNQRAELAQLKNQLRQTEDSIRMIRSAKIPNLSFNGAYSHTKNIEFVQSEIPLTGTIFSGKSSSTLDIWSGGLTLRWSPWDDVSVDGSRKYDFRGSSIYSTTDSVSLSLNDGTSTRVSLEEALLARRRLEREEVTTRQKIEDDVATAFEQYFQAQSSRESARARLAFTEERSRVELARAQLGLNTYKDILDARQEVVQAELSVIQADYMLALAVAQIERAAGVKSIPTKEAEQPPVEAPAEETPAPETPSIEPAVL